MFETQIQGFVFKIKQDPTQRNKLYCVMQNPFTKAYDTKFIYGSSLEIIIKKIERQYKKFEGECK